MTRGLPSQPVPNRRLVTAEGGSSSLLYNLRGAQSPDAYLSNDDWLALPIPTAAAPYGARAPNHSKRGE